MLKTVGVPDLLGEIIATWTKRGLACHLCQGKMLQECASMCVTMHLHGIQMLYFDCFCIAKNRFSKRKKHLCHL